MNGCVQVLHLRLMFVPLPTSLGQRVIAGDSRSWVCPSVSQLQDFSAASWIWGLESCKLSNCFDCSLYFRFTSHDYLWLRHTTSYYFNPFHSDSRSAIPSFLRLLTPGIQESVERDLSKLRRSSGALGVFFGKDLRHKLPSHVINTSFAFAAGNLMQFVRFS